MSYFHLDDFPLKKLLWTWSILLLFGKTRLTPHNLALPISPRAWKHSLLRIILKNIEILQIETTRWNQISYCRAFHRWRYYAVIFRGSRDVLDLQNYALQNSKKFSVSLSFDNFIILKLTYFNLRFPLTAISLIFVPFLNFSIGLKCHALFILYPSSSTAICSNQCSMCLIACGKLTVTS